MGGGVWGGRQVDHHIHNCSGITSPILCLCRGPITGLGWLLILEKEGVEPCSRFTILLLAVPCLLSFHLHFISFLSCSSSSPSYAVSYLSASLLVPVTKCVTPSANLQSENKFHSSSFCKVQIWEDSGADGELNFCDSCQLFLFPEDDLVTAWIFCESLLFLFEWVILFLIVAVYLIYNIVLVSDVQHSDSVFYRLYYIKSCYKIIRISSYLHRTLRSSFFALFFLGTSLVSGT